MKRIIAVLSAVIILVVTVFAGLTVAAEEDLTGEWSLQSMEQGGMKMDASLLTMFGLNITMTLNEDGTMALKQADGEQSGTWSADGTMTIDGIEATFKVEDGTIIIEEEDQIMVFSHEGSGTGNKLAPAVAVTEISDFEGTWNAETFVALGMSLPLESAGVQIELTIADGKAAVSEAVLDMENEGEVLDSMEAEFDATLQEDGTLFIDFAGQNILEQLQLNADGIYLTLHEDGRLSGTIPEIEDSMSVEGDVETEETEGDSAGDSSETSDGGSSGSESAEPSMYLILVKAE